MTDWPGFLAALAATERAHVLTRRAPPGCVPWIPLPLAQFAACLTDAVTAAPGDCWSFLDVGCGPGTKVALAQRLYGLDGYGIDIEPAFTAQAARLGVSAGVADAMTWGRYGEYGIVYLNRPVSGAGREQLASRVMSQMRPGAVLIAVNGAARPGERGWETVAEDADTGDGAWRKPA